MLLAIKGHGDYRWIDSGRIGQAVSLTDLAPTLLDVLDMGDDARASAMDGTSLRPLLEDPTARVADRPVFMESGFSVPAILTVHPSLQDVFRQGFQHYRVDRSDGRLFVKKSSHRHILDSKQRAVVYADWQLGSIIDEQTGETLYGLRRLQDDAWTDDMGSELVRTAPIARLRHYLTEHFGEELHGREQGVHIADNGTNR